MKRSILVKRLRSVVVCGVATALLCAIALSGCAAGAPSAAPSSSSVATSASSSSSSATASDMVVEVTVSSPDAGDQVSFAGSVDLPADATVLDALKATGLTVDAKDSEYGMFVEAIDGLAGEGMKGWTYTVNGEQVQSSADKRTVVDGDAVEWSYIDMSK